MSEMDTDSQNIPGSDSLMNSKTGLKMNINKWSAVGYWKWNRGTDDEDLCGICRNPFEACCAKCQMPGDECPIMIGVCRHYFHMHCIFLWLHGDQGGNPNCPLCRQPWQCANATNSGSGSISLPTSTSLITNSTTQ